MFVKGWIYRGWKGCYTTLKGGMTSETAGCAFSAHYSAAGYGWLSVSRGGDTARFGFSYQYTAFFFNQVGKITQAVYKIVRIQDTIA